MVSRKIHPSSNEVNTKRNSGSENRNTDALQRGTGLHDYVFRGCKETLEEELTTENISNLNEDGETVLHTCIRSPFCDASLFKFLLRKAKETSTLEQLIRTRDNEKNSVVHCIARAQRYDFLQELEEIDQLDPKLHFLSEEHPVDGSPLHIAACYRDAKMFWKLWEFLLSKHEAGSANQIGILVSVMNQKTVEAKPLLHICAQQAQSAMVEAMITAHCDLEIQDDSGNTVLHDLVLQMLAKPSLKENFLRIFDLVTRHAATWYKRVHRDVKFKTCLSRDIKRKAIRYLLEIKRNNDGNTVMEYICKLGAADIMRYIYSLEFVYKFYDGDMVKFDVTNLTPYTMVERKSEDICDNKGHDIMRSNVQNESKAGHFTRQSTKGVNDNNHCNSWVGTKNRVDADLTIEVANLNLYPVPCKENDTVKQTISRSLLESIVGVEDKALATKMLDASPIKYLIHDYWGIYKWLYVIGLVFHTVYMGAFSGFATDTLQDVWLHSLNDTYPKSTAKKVTASIFISWPVAVMIYSLTDIIFVCVCNKNDKQINKIHEGNTTNGSEFKRNIGKVEKIFRMLNKGFAILTSDISIYIRLCFCLSSFAWLFYYHKENSQQIYAVALVLVSGWLHTINFARGFETINIFIIMVKYMILRDVFTIMIVYSFILTGFSFLFYTFFQVSEELIEFNRSYSDVLFLTFSWMIGAATIYKDEESSRLLFDDVSFNTRFVSGAYLFYVVLTTMLLLNILIAMMSDTYADVRNREGTNWRVETITTAIFWENNLLLNLIKKGRKALLDYEIRCENNRSFLLMPVSKVDLKVVVFKSKTSYKAKTNLIDHSEPL